MACAASRYWLLVEALAEGDDLLARRAQSRQRRGDFAQRGVAGELPGGRCAAARVRCACRPCAASIARSRSRSCTSLGAVVAERLRASARLAGSVLYCSTSWPSGAITSVVRSSSGCAPLAGARSRPARTAAAAEEQQVEHQPAGEIHRVPQPDEEAGDGAAAAGFVHCGDAPEEMRTACTVRQRSGRRVRLHAPSVIATRRHAASRQHGDAAAAAQEAPRTAAAPRPSARRSGRSTCPRGPQPRPRPSPAPSGMPMPQ